MAMTAHAPHSEPEEEEEEEMVTLPVAPWSASPRTSEDAFQTQPLIKPDVHNAVEEKRLWFQRRPARDPNAIATQPSVFDDPELAKYYQPRKDWENLLRFDPSARWTWAEEHKLLRKLDLRIMVFACIMFMTLELDRANLQQAITDNFLGDLGLDTNGSSL